MKVKEKNIVFTDWKTLTEKTFDVITIYKRIKKHKYSDCNCMFFRLRNENSDEDYFIKGEQTDVISLEKMTSCFIDVGKDEYGNYFCLYHCNFEIVSCYETFRIRPKK